MGVLKWIADRWPVYTNRGWERSRREVVENLRGIGYRLQASLAVARSSNEDHRKARARLWEELEEQKAKVEALGHLKVLDRFCGAVQGLEDLLGDRHLPRLGAIEADPEFQRATREILRHQADFFTIHQRGAQGYETLHFLGVEIRSPSETPPVGSITLVPS